jgi:hypothetical protein
VPRAHLALDEVFLDEISRSRKEIDVASVETEADDRLFPGSRSIDPRKNGDIEIALDLLGEVDEILRKSEGGHFRRVR